MNSTSLPQRTATMKIVRRMQDPAFVAPVSDYTLGRRMFRDCIAYTACTTFVMRCGWLDAASAALDAEYENGGIASMDALAEVLQ